VLSHQFLGEQVLGDRIGATGVRFDVAAENVAAGETVEEVHQGLMDSAQHRANVLSSKFNAVGLAVVSREGDLYVTQDFAHVLPSYSEQQFRDAITAAFNKARRANGFGPMPARADSHLYDLACSDNDDLKQMLGDLPGATNMVMFTSSAPEKLSPSMQKAAADKSLHRVDLGVCFKPGKEHGYGSFRVVAAFYP